MFAMLRCITSLTLSTFWFTALSLSILLRSSYFLHASSSNFLHLLFKYPSFLSAGTLPLFAGNWEFKSSVKEGKRLLRAGAFKLRSELHKDEKMTTYTFLTVIEAGRCASLRIWRSTEKDIDESVVIFNVKVEENISYLKMGILQKPHFVDHKPARWLITRQSIEDEIWDPTFSRVVSLVRYSLTDVRWIWSSFG